MPIIYMSYVLGYINTFIDDSGAPSDSSQCVCKLPTRAEMQFDETWGYEREVMVELDDGSCDGFVSNCISGFTSSDASTIHQDFLMNNAAVLLLVIPYCGIMADSVEPYLALPIAFASRMLLAFLFIYFITSPQGDWYIFMSCGLNAAS